MHAFIGILFSQYPSSPEAARMTEGRKEYMVQERLLWDPKGGSHAKLLMVFVKGGALAYEGVCALRKSVRVHIHPGLSVYHPVHWDILSWIKWFTTYQNQCCQRERKIHYF